MAKTIDQRVVELGFENKSFERGVGQSLDSIEALKKGLNFSGATKGLEQINQNASNVNFNAMAEGIDTVRSRLSVMGAVAFTIIQDMTRGIINFGQKVADTLVLDPIKMGFSEYETKMNAVQTILANTSKAGVTLEDVTNVLDELNTYADQTIYNFTEMTRNIGTFTAAGIDLDTSAAAIKGIANLAAVSGSNAHQASTAMYQLSQALSTGALKLQDWNSVVNAGMGGMVFQDALKETARAHGVAVDEMIEQNGSFRESLKEGWITKDVLTETLAKFTGDLTAAQLEAMGYAEHQVEEILKLGEVANDAATKVKTVTQLGETLQEAMQSGWTQTWEILIGDFNEAKETLTKVSEVLGNIIGMSATGRNELLQKWKDLGGRDSLIKGLWNAFDALKGIIDTIKGAWEKVFPPIFAEQLLLWTFRFEAFTEKLKMGSKVAGKVGLIFQGFFSILDVARKIVVALLGAFASFTGNSILELGEKILTFTAWISLMVIDMNKGLDVTDQLREGFEKFVDFLGPYGAKLAEFVDKVKLKLMYLSIFIPLLTDALVKDFVARFKPMEAVGGTFEALKNKLIEFVTKIKPKFKELTFKIGPQVETFLGNITTAINNFDVDRFIDLLGKGLIGALLLAIRNFIANGADMLEGVSDMLEGVGDVLTAWQRDLQSKVLLRIGAAILVLAVALMLIASIPGDKLAGALSGLTVMMVELLLAMKGFAAISLKPTNLLQVAAALVLMGLAMASIAGVVRVLSLIEPRELSRGLMALAAILALVKVAAVTLTQKAGNFIKASVAIRTLAGALILLSGVVFILGKMKPETVSQGVLALLTILMELAAFIMLVNNTKGLIATAVALQIIAGALYLFIGAVVLMGMVPAEVIGAGLLALGGALGILVGVIHAMPRGADLIGAALGLTIVAGAMYLVMGVITAFGLLPTDVLTQGMIAFSSSLVVMALALMLMQSNVAGALALIIAAGAITILAGALALLGQLDIKQLGIGLLGILGIVVILGVAGYLLAPLAPALLLLGGALLLVGTAALFFGKGILLLSAGLAALGVSGAAGIAVLGLALYEVTKYLPAMGAAIADFIIVVIQKLAEYAPQLLESLKELILVFVQAIVEITPELINAIFLLVTTLIQKFADSVPDLVQAGYDILLGFLHGVEDNIGEVVETAGQIVINFLEEIGKKGPEVIDAGWKMIINFINGVADSARENIPAMMDAVRNLGQAIRDGIIEGITEGNGVIGAIWDLGEGIIWNFKQVLGINSPAKAIFDQMRFVIDGVVFGIRKFGKRAYDASSTFASKFVDSFGAITNELSSSINDNVEFDPVVTPVMDLTNIESGAGLMSNLVKDADLSTTLSGAASISASLNQQQLDALKAATTLSEQPEQPVQYIQNNYSPKALSPYTIWRQTNNQLKLAAKGVK